MLPWLYQLSCLQYKYIALPNKVLSRYKWEKNGLRWHSLPCPVQNNQLGGCWLGLYGIWGALKLSSEIVQIQQTKKKETKCDRKRFFMVKETASDKHRRQAWQVPEEDSLVQVTTITINSHKINEIRIEAVDNYTGVLLIVKQ